ncbi:MAG: hypothetical protein II817_02845 [Bacteroidales bacterium]|nr:hypothetical protein [Bacteroidales bacterium]
MKMLLKRRFLGNKYTIGTLYIDGIRFCDTLEDKNRDVNKNGRFDKGEKKVQGETCIPYGIYKVTLNLSPRFKRPLPRLMDVPDFEGVLIHRGNTAKDTQGCILVGENKVKGKVINSTPYEVELVRRCTDAIANHQEITIEIV